MNSPFDHYVSVAYFENGRFVESKLNYYEKEKAEQIFARTLNKYTIEKNVNVIIQLRDQFHNLLKAERNFGWEIEGTKTKRKRKSK